MHHKTSHTAHSYGQLRSATLRHVILSYTSRFAVIEPLYLPQIMSPNSNSMACRNFMIRSGFPVPFSAVGNPPRNSMSGAVAAQPSLQQDMFHDATEISNPWSTQVDSDIMGENPGQTAQGNLEQKKEHCIDVKDLKTPS